MSDESDRFSSIRSETDAILAVGGPFGDVASRILRTLCLGLGWNVGLIWRLDESARRLRWVASWHDPSDPVTELEKLSMRSTFSPGVGLPGRILSAGEPWWIRNVQRDRAFPRSLAATEDGLRSAFGVPILTGRKCVGIIELFSREEMDSDRELLVSVASIGAQVGEVLEAEIDDH
jgi:GAF domain-containing protein